MVRFQALLAALKDSLEKFTYWSTWWRIVLGFFTSKPCLFVRQVETRRIFSLYFSIAFLKIILIKNSKSSVNSLISVVIPLDKKTLSFFFDACTNFQISIRSRQNKLYSNFTKDFHLKHGLKLNPLNTIWCYIHIAKHNWG